MKLLWQDFALERAKVSQTSSTPWWEAWRQWTTKRPSSRPFMIVKWDIPGIIRFFLSRVFYSSWGRKNTRYKIGSIFELDACCFRYLTSCLNGCLASMTCRSTTSSPPLRSSSASPTDPSPRASCGRCWRERRFDKFPSSRWPALPVIHRKALNCKEPYPRHCFKVQAVSVVAWPVRRRYMNLRPLQYWG